jgi:hypothetical protein
MVNTMGIKGTALRQIADIVFKLFKTFQKLLTILPNKIPQFGGYLILCLKI